jgi:preprotein translocase subunit SecG
MADLIQEARGVLEFFGKKPLGTCHAGNYWKQEGLNRPARVFGDNGNVFMQSVLIVVHLMIVVALVVTVLLQRSEGGAIGIGGGGGFMTGRGQANALTRATAILAALFFATSLGLTFLARLTQGPGVTFQSITPLEPAKKDAEGKGSLLDQLQRMEDQASKPPALPPGMNLPGGNGPAAPQPGHSVLETGPAAPAGPNLPLPAVPATPLVPAAPAQTAPAAPASPLKTMPRDYPLPWAK